VAPTVEDLCKLYLKEHAIPHKKPSSVAKDRQNIKNHIIPRLGTRKVASISFADVERLHREMHRTPMAANRVLSLLSKMFNLAERWGLRKGTNPTKHVRRYRERKVHRHLSEIEVARFAKILREAESSADPTVAVNPRAVAIIRLLMFTGCRRGEVLNLKWSEVDLDRNLIRLEDSKTGPKIVPLNSAAREVIAAQAGVPDNPYVFPGTKPGRPLHDIKGPWDHIRQRAGLEGVRLHDLRHNFASFAAAGGLSLHMIGRLLGHRTPLTTARYADLADDPARRASEKVGGVLSTLLSGGERA
jgi:integrase